MEPTIRTIKCNTTAKVVEVWNIQKSNGKVWARAELFGFLKFKFRNDQRGAKLKLKEIPNLAIQ